MKYSFVYCFMMRLSLPIIAATLLLAACNTSTMTEAQIKEQITAANYCDSPNDCVDVGGKCPFDCYIFVNMKEEDRIKAMVEGYASTCTYSCLAINDVDCVEHKCQPVLDRPERVSDDTEGNVGASCTSDEECHTPMDYLIRSSCPFTSMCIEGSCSVVCPMMEHDPNPVISKSSPVTCQTNSDCTCDQFMAGSNADCRCVENACVAVMY